MKKLDRIIKEAIDKAVIDKIGVKLSYKPIIREMRAYHGSRSKFGEFSTDFISSGEGSQVYGWGIYVTQNIDTGKFYCEASLNTRDLCIFGKSIRDFSDEELAELGEGYVSLKYFYKRNFEKTTSSVIQFAKNCLYEDEYTINSLKNSISRSKENGEYIDEEYIEQLNFLEKRLENARILNKWLKDKDFFDSLYKGDAYFYTVEIPDDNGNNYLQWDRNYDFEELRDLISRLKYAGLRNEAGSGIIYQLIGDYHTYLEGKVTGELIYKRLLEVYGGNGYDTEEGADKSASLLLSKSGFDGIKVPIGFIHGSNVEGYNYVIFDASKIKILKIEDIHI